MKVILLAAAVLSVDPPNPPGAFCLKNSENFGTTHKWYARNSIIIPEYTMKLSSFSPFSSLTKFDHPAMTDSFLLKQQLTGESSLNFYRKLNIISRLIEYNAMPFDMDCYIGKSNGYVELLLKEGMKKFHVYEFINISLLGRFEFYMNLVKKIQWFNKHKIVFPFWGPEDIIIGKDNNIFIFNAQYAYKTKEPVYFYSDLIVPAEVTQSAVVQELPTKNGRTKKYLAARATPAWNIWRILKFIADMESYNILYADDKSSQQGAKTQVYKDFSEYMKQQFSTSSELRADVNEITDHLERVYREIRDIIEKPLKDQTIESEPLLKNENIKNL